MRELRVVLARQTVREKTLERGTLRDAWEWRLQLVILLRSQVTVTSSDGHGRKSFGVDAS